MHDTSIQYEIERLKHRLESLTEQAETEIRQRLKEARQVVADLEMQLSEITDRASASQIQAAKGFAPLTDEQLEAQIMFVVQKAGEDGISGADIARQLNQDAVRVRRWIKDHPEKLRREGSGPATRCRVLL